ncbi:MAG TPA: hypothetical protein VN728_06955 [Stellaceae bacterium]|jgi:hypothetical protein|nr:hypothetical protein [Stellaceae bacterium]
MKRPAKPWCTAIAPAGLWAAAVLLAAAPHLARAQSAQQQSFRAWDQMTACAQLAAQKYPDHTPEANAQREAYRQNCLRQRHLPVTGAPPPPANNAR